MQFQNHKEEILQISQRNGIVIRKNQGQCFLINEHVANFIIDQANLDSEKDIVLEIGPGFGSLTQKLVEKSYQVCAIEIDRKICKYLQKKFDSNKNFMLENKDALKFSSFPKHTKLISNVPYHISGPLIQKIVTSEEKADLIILMLQEEFINRMRAEPQAKGYGRLSVISQLFFEITELRRVSRFDFYPQPDVESGIIQLKFNPEFVGNPNIPHFIEFLAGIFPYKNKIITKALKLLKKSINNFPKLASLDNFDLGTEISTEMKNKRVWQLSPWEVWDLFECFKNA